MKILSFAVILVVLACTIYGVRFFLLLQKSKALVAHAVPFEKSGDASMPPYLFVGDSTAVGVGSARSEDTYAGYFAHDFPNRTIRNLSKSGRKTNELLPILRKEVDASADWVFLQAGGNDILYFTRNEDIARDIDDALKEAKRIGKHTVLLTSGNVGLAPFFPRWMGSIWSTKTRAVRKIFQDSAEKHGALYIDLYREREDDLFLTDIPRFYGNDLLHPSGDGYKYWYDETRKAINAKGLEDAL